MTLRQKRINDCFTQMEEIKVEIGKIKEDLIRDIEKDNYIDGLRIKLYNRCIRLAKDTEARLHKLWKLDEK